jgi:3-phenylpropionate/trans-cinnamate dioxygenase ferredoxin reductase subunit
MATRYLIVGGGLAAASAIEGIRELDTDGEIVLLTAEKELPYHRPPLSKGFLAGREQVEAVRVHEPAWYRAHGVRVKLGQVAKSVHLRRKSVTVVSGERESYDRLLLATGSRPRRLNAPGIDTPGVVLLRTLADSAQLRSLIRPGVRLVCVGSGFIGMEVAATARDLGAEVTVLEAGPGPYRAFADPELGAFFQRLLESRGVTFMMNVRVNRFRAENGRLAGIATEGGETIPAGVAVVGVGAEPNTEWLAAAGFQIDRGGIVVNGRLETQGQDVWAAGDIARFPDPVTRQPRRLEHWDNALWQGRQAGRNMAGADEQYAHQSLFFSDLSDVTMNVLGDTDKPDRVVMLGSTDVKAPQFTAYYVRANKLTGGVLVNASSADRRVEFETLQRHLTEGTTPELP